VTENKQLIGLISQYVFILLLQITKWFYFQYTCFRGRDVVSFGDLFPAFRATVSLSASRFKGQNVIELGPRIPECQFFSKRLVISMDTDFFTRYYEYLLIPLLDSKLTPI
jgi:hypothetical protein